MFFKLALIATGTLVFAGCATQSERFEKVEVGMEKHDVLELLGNPKYTRRIRSVDRWGYIYYQDGVRNEKQIHFKQGNVVYKGLRPLPKVSAEEQDQINMQQNAQVAQQQAQESLEHKRRLEQDYLDYNTGGNKKGHRVPRFVPVEGSQ